MKLCPITFTSSIRLDASRINKHGSLQMLKVIDYAEENHDKTVLDVVKSTLNDGKDDKYKLVYDYEKRGICNFPVVNLYKNNTLIIEKSSNNDHCELANDVLRELAYYNLSKAQKNEMKADIEVIKNQLLDC